jgi:hypothetical protein
MSHDNWGGFVLLSRIDYFIFILYIIKLSDLKKVCINNFLTMSLKLHLCEFFFYKMGKTVKKTRFVKSGIWQ